MSHRQIKTNLSALIVADAVAKLLPLLTFPYITRVLGPETYGMYGFAMSIVGFVALFASPGFTTFGIRAAAQNPEQGKRLASEITGVRLLFGSIALLVLGLYVLILAPSEAMVRTLILIGSLSLITNAVSLDWLLTGASTIGLAQVSPRIVTEVSILRTSMRRRARMRVRSKPSRLAFRVSSPSTPLAS